MMKLKKFKDDEEGIALAITALVLIGLGLVIILGMLTLASAIIPIAIALILIIMIALIVKSFLKPGGGFGLIKSATGFTREAGRSGLGLFDSAKSEYRHRRK